MNSRDKAVQIAEALLDRKAEEVRVFDMAAHCSFTDFFVIASGTSDRHVKACAESALERCRELGEKPLGSEGMSGSRWVLVDFGDVVLHVFSREAREFYALERLWGEAERVALPDESAENSVA